MRDPEEDPEQEEGAATSPASSESISAGRKDHYVYLLWDKDRLKEVANKDNGGNASNCRICEADPRPPSEGTWSAKKGEREDGTEIDLPPSEK
jgi:hypothetical protein